MRCSILTFRGASHYDHQVEWAFGKPSSISQTLGTKTHNICYHASNLEGIAHWPLAWNMKA
jgi:hypothetical protein